MNSGDPTIIYADWFDRVVGLMDAGGIVMWPLLAMSVLAVALAFERLVFWVNMNRRVRLRYKRTVDAIRSGDRERVEALASEDDSPFSQLAERLSQGADPQAASVEVLEGHRPKIERWMLVFSTIVTAAPMLGILGTVLGIIHSFELLGAQQTITDPRDVSAGIAEALLTTAFGLVVALIALVPSMACRGQVERTLGRLEAMAAAAHGVFSK